MFFDPMWLLISAPGMILALFASIKVKSTFKKYSEVASASGMTGADVAKELIRRHGVQGVRVEPHEGFLTDHYDPTAKVVRLSEAVYYGRSLAAIGVAAHECGHVLQDAKGYAPMAIRQYLVGPANFGSTLSWILIVAGAALHVSGMVWLGILAFSAVVLFQLVTLPVEFNASSRARKHLVADGIISVNEDGSVGKVLNAAALTYVAALITSVLQLAYFLIQYAGVGRSSED